MVDQVKKYINEIPVVLSTDLNYVFQAFVVIAGILKKVGEDTFYHFYILTYEEPVRIKEIAAPLEGKLRQSYRNFTVRIVPVNERELDGAGLTSAHITLATYNRLLIPDLITEWDKCIYLDCDVYINCDIMELYNRDIRGNYLLGVRDSYLVIEDLTYSAHRECMGVPSLQNYINAGVLVMNLALLREDGMRERFREQMAKKNILEDQDVLNACCYGRIGLLPLKYNLLHIYYGNTISLLRDYTDPAEFDFDPYQPAILHFADTNKPWKNIHCKGAGLWWETASVFDKFEIFEECRKKSLEETEVFDIRHLFSQCRQKRYVIVWGFAGYGKEAIELLRRNGIINITYICDNNTSYHNQYFEELKIIGPGEIDLPLQDILWVISCKVAGKQVKKQLLDMGAKEEDIYQLYKPVNFYRSQSENRQEEELRQIMIREYGQEHADAAYARIFNTKQRGDWEQREYDRLALRYLFDEWLVSGEQE